MSDDANRLLAGKYYGQTFDDINAHHKGYCYWVKTNLGHARPELFRDFIDFLDEHSNDFNESSIDEGEENLSKLHLSDDQLSSIIRFIYDTRDSFNSRRATFNTVEHLLYCNSMKPRFQYYIFKALRSADVEIPTQPYKQTLQQLAEKIKEKAPWLVSNSKWLFYCHNDKRVSHNYGTFMKLFSTDEWHDAFFSERFEEPVIDFVDRNWSKIFPLALVDSQFTHKVKGQLVVDKDEVTNFLIRCKMHFKGMNINDIDQDDIEANESSDDGSSL